MGRNLDLKRGEFRTWLDNNQDYVVGQARTSDKCPLATYLVDRTGKRWNISMRECVEYRYPTQMAEVDHFFNTPRWARDFIQVLDREYRTREVLGSEALALLDEAVR